MKTEGTSRVTWEIEQVEDSCRLTVTHDQLREGANDELYGGWPMILSGLKTLLETGEELTTPGLASLRRGPRVRAAADRADTGRVVAARRVKRSSALPRAAPRATACSTDGSSSCRASCRRLDGRSRGGPCPSRARRRCRLARGQRPVGVHAGELAPQAEGTQVLAPLEQEVRLDSACRVLGDLRVLVALLEALAVHLDHARPPLGMAARRSDELPHGLQRNVEVSELAVGGHGGESTSRPPCTRGPAASAPARAMPPRSPRRDPRGRSPRGGPAPPGSRRSAEL